MAVPKKRHTKSRRDRRRMHIFIEASSLIDCPTCGKKKLPHTVCPYCGSYKGKEVINVLEKLNKKEKKEREREIKDKEREKKPLTLRELSKR